MEVSTNLDTTISKQSSKICKPQSTAVSIKILLSQTTRSKEHHPNSYMMRTNYTAAARCGCSKEQSPLPNQSTIFSAWHSNFATPVTKILKQKDKNRQSSTSMCTLEIMHICENRESFTSHQKEVYISDIATPERVVFFSTMITDKAPTL